MKNANSDGSDGNVGNRQGRKQPMPFWSFQELKKQGYDIIVASNGGVYEKELAEAGIRHYHVPLNQRNVLKWRISF